MRRLFIIGVACAALVACKETKQDKCKATWKKMSELTREMTKAFGGSAADMPTAEDKKAFMDKCLSLSDEALACITDPSKMMDPKCEEVMQKAEDAEPVAKVELAWDTAPVADKRATAKFPKGWTHEDFMGDAWTPPDDARLGSSTYSVDNTCGGDCTKLSAAEWAKRIEDNDVANLKGEGDTTISKDEKLGDTSRMIVAETKLGHSKQTKLMIFSWQEGGESYFVCKAELDRALSANLDDFVEACKALKIDSFSASTGGGDLDELGDDDDEPVDAGK
jgi:hypothetical protein